jgi:ubiquinone/menaquinone biosynthesis C-methylase UbiE
MRARNTTQPDWTAYASAYDLMADNNPAYQDLRRRFTETLALLRLRSGGTFAEFGAGTGNFSVELARLHRDCNVVHVDADEAMIRAATNKAAASGLTNMEFVRGDVAQIGLADSILDFAAAIHCMYTFPDPAAFVASLFRWLRPGGIVFACDPGRVVNVAEWSMYLFRESWKRAGLSGAVSLFWRGRAAFTQNCSIRWAQQQNAYWTHSHAAFRDVFTVAGFRIIESDTVYRGCSDLVVCQKP